MMAAVPTTVVAASAAEGAGEEAREERVELGDAILWDVDRDLLVVGCGWG
jgi:hypothetical protein